jgi:hypothetical protein
MVDHIGLLRAGEEHMSNIYYSAKSNGFYHTELEEDYKASADGWPDDAIAVSDEEYQSLLEGQAIGKVMAADNSGRPTLSDPVINWQARAEQQRQKLYAAANNTISLWQTKLLAGKALTDDQKMKLDAWLDYMDKLEAMDLSVVKGEAAYNAIGWPKQP